MRKVVISADGDFRVNQIGSSLFVFEGDFELEEVDLNKYVQVKFLGGYNAYKLYTYIDPGFDLKVGDLVNVPTVYKPENVAQVVKLGDGYNGKAKAEVNAVYQPLWISPDGQVGYDDRITYHTNREFDSYDSAGCCGGGCFCDPSNGDCCS